MEWRVTRTWTVKEGMDPTDLARTVGRYAYVEAITVTDDGRGIDPSMIDQIFQPGFSTAAEVSHISGRGVGLDVVKTSIEALGGSVRVRSKPGQGSSFEFSLPA